MAPARRSPAQAGGQSARELRERSARSRPRRFRASLKELLARPRRSGAAMPVPRANRGARLRVPSSDPKVPARLSARRMPPPGGRAGSCRRPAHQKSLKAALATPTPRRSPRRAPRTHARDQRMLTDRDWAPTRACAVRSRRVSTMLANMWQIFTCDASLYQEEGLQRQTGVALARCGRVRGPLGGSARPLSRWGTSDASAPSVPCEVDSLFAASRQCGLGLAAIAPARCGHDHQTTRPLRVMTSCLWTSYSSAMWDEPLMCRFTLS
jgi:hypothetical protein